MLAAEYQIELPRPSLLIVLALFLIGGASVAVFSLLVRRWTTRRQWVSLTDWSKQRRMKLASRSTAMPAVIAELSKLDPKVRIQIGDESVTVMQFDTASRDAQEGAPNRQVWNVLIRKLASGRSHPPAALRPANVLPSRSVIDLFNLTPFHSLGNNRFSVMAADGISANRLANSSVRALLPPDVGVLLHREAILLDFSTRPLDPIELDRMIALAEQISAAT